jgi:threonine dehydrogenase-like Zn-dependent dehydrogenase
MPRTRHQFLGRWSGKSERLAKKRFEGSKVKAVVFHGVGDIRVDDVPEPEFKDPTDAVVRLTSSAICGTDLHFVRGTMSATGPGNDPRLGPVGQFSILSAKLFGAGQVLAIDGRDDRLATARQRAPR